MSEEPQMLPPIPVDDEALALIDHALDACLDESFELVGAEFGLHQLLDFWAGFDPAKVRVMVEMSDGVPGMSEYVGGALYHPNDVIRALIAEVRRLRGAAPSEFSPKEATRDRASGEFS